MRMKALIANNTNAYTVAYGCELIISSITKVVPSMSEIVVLLFTQAVV